MAYLATKAVEKLKDGKLGGIGMVSPLFGAINSRQKKKRLAAAGAAGWRWHSQCWKRLFYKGYLAHNDERWWRCFKSWKRRWYLSDRQDKRPYGLMKGRVRDYQQEYRTQKARGEHSDRMERQRARRKMDSTSADLNGNGKADKREGKDISHKVALSKGGSNADGVTVESRSANRSRNYQSKRRKSNVSRKA